MPRRKLVYETKPWQHGRLKSQCINKKWKNRGNSEDKIPWHAQADAYSEKEVSSPLLNRALIFEN